MLYSRKKIFFGKKKKGSFYFVNSGKLFLYLNILVAGRETAFSRIYVAGQPMYEFPNTFC